jgi:hypothetical protein
LRQRGSQQWVVAMVKDLDGGVARCGDDSFVTGVQQSPP